MRLISNKESVARGEVTVLAIVETLLAIALVFYLSKHFNTLRWLAVAMYVSPLLLLRTEESTRLGIEWWYRASNAIARLSISVGQFEMLIGRSVREKRLLLAFLFTLLWF